MKDTSVIPEGMYCYDHKGLCPYWSWDDSAPTQQEGCCSFLNTTDVQISKEGGFGLLWDQCKECGVNKDYKGEEDEQAES